MMNDDAVVISGLGKKFRRYGAHRPTTLKEAVVRGRWQLAPVETFWVFRNVSFNVRRGEVLGIIGRNGAGKSTLLRLTGGVGMPDEGTGRVNGRIGSLLELGPGFHPDLTGRENVFISGVIDGLSRRSVAERMDEIVEFAEIREFIDSPLRTYSTGMQMRLAFAVAIHTDPNVLLVDEFLSVGDLGFQKKCLDRITQIREKGCAIVLVSHDMGQVKKMCQKVLWLRKDRPHVFGDAEVVVGQYESESHEEMLRRTPRTMPALATPAGTTLKVNENRFGSMELEVRVVELLDGRGVRTSEIACGDPLSVQLQFHSRRVEAPKFAIAITNEENEKCCEIGSAASRFELSTVEGAGCVVLHIDRLDLTPGRYFVDIGVYERNWEYAYDYHWHAYPLIVAGVGSGAAPLSPPHQWQTVAAENAGVGGAGALAEITPNLSQATA